MKALQLVLALSFFSTANTLHAGSATWKGDPTTNDWNNAANWMPGTVPNGPTDTATFTTSAIVDVFLSTKTQVDGIVFTPGANSFTITSEAGALHFTGTGISNASGVEQSFIANAR